MFLSSYRKKKNGRKSKDNYLFLLFYLFFESFSKLFLAINARGLLSNLLFDLVEKSGSDICFIQETLVPALM